MRANIDGLQRPSFALVPRWISLTVNSPVKRLSKKGVRLSFCRRRVGRCPGVLSFTASIRSIAIAAYVTTTACASNATKTNERLVYTR